MSTVSGSINLSIIAREILSSGISKGVVNRSFESLLDLPSGSNDNQVNRCYAKRETGIAASITTSYDLIGSLLDEDGATINFSEVVLIACRNLSSTLANDIRIGPHATVAGFGVLATSKGFWSAAADKSIIGADGDSWVVMYSKAGVPAVAATTDVLVVVTEAGTSLNTWDLLVLGRTN